MSYVRLVVRDATRDLSGDCHGATADRVVAALSADPETIEELQAAVERFEHDHHVFSCFSPGIDDEPYDAGLMVIDLAARLVAYESSYSAPCTRGHVDYHDGKCATDITLSYHLADDWKFLRDVLHWDAVAENRRRERSAQPPLDARAILYGRKLVEFLATECLAAFQSAAEEFTAAGLERAETRRKIDAGEIEPDNPYGYFPRYSEREQDAVREIHARWLTTPRDDLRGQAPRDWLLLNQEHISWDLQDRSEQWSMMGRPPRGLNADSHAFRFGGCGRHEVVKYYDLVREMLWSCWERLLELGRSTKPSERPQALARGDFLTDEVPRLEAWRDEWFDAPDPECQGLSPRVVIDHERLRMPEGFSGHEAMVDHDCPLCQMMTDMPGPMFWGLDGSNMDDEFAFSFHRTREEWDAEQRKHEAWNRRWKEREAQLEQLGVKHPGAGYSDPDYAWQRSFVRSDDNAALPLAVRLFSLGSLLAELIVDLKQPPEDRELIDALSRDWGNLREVSQSEDLERAAALIEPVLDRFGETLSRVAAAREELEEKCSDLQERLRRFLEPPSETDDDSGTNDYRFDDVPF